VHNVNNLWKTFSDEKNQRIIKKIKLAAQKNLSKSFDDCRSAKIFSAGLRKK